MSAAISTINHCISQPNIRIQNRQTRNRKREKDPAVKAKIAAWVVGKFCSCGCGRPANCAHHIKGEMYESDEAYLNLDECEPYYSTCHHNMHKGLVRCPSCGGWMTKGREKCARCEGWTGKKTRRWKPDHPCKSHQPSGICGLSHTDMRCTYARTKAMKPAPVGCVQAEAKKGAVKA